MPPPPPYMFQANAILPPMAPHVRLNNDQSVSNPFVLYTEIAQSPDNSISQPQDSQISSLEGRFNSSTDEINENGRFAKFTEEINGNKVDCMCIIPNNEKICQAPKRA